MDKFFADRTLPGLLLEGERRLLLGGIVASAANAAGTITLIAYIKDMIEGGSAPTVGVMLLLAALVLVILMSHIASGGCISTLGARAMATMRRRLAGAIAATDYEHIERIGPPRIYAAFSEDLPRIAMAYTAMPAVLLNCVILACALGYLALVSPRHLLLMLGLIGAALVVSERFLLRQMKLYNEQLREGLNRLYQAVQALVYGSKEIKLNRAREAFYRERLLDTSVQELYHSTQRREFFISVYNGWSASVVLILLAGVLCISQWWLPMSRGQMIAFALVLMFARGPLIALVNNVPHLSACNLALRKIRELKLTARPSFRAAGAPPDGHWRELALDAAGFEYRAEDGTLAFRLEPVSLKVRRGEVLYVTGGNGSGKSTLAKLLVGLYRPTSGTVRLDGEPVTADTLDTYRGHFSAIFGDYYLFAQALDGLGNPPADEALRARLRAVALEDKVQVRGGELSTLSLSHGQRKRLALVIALAEDRPILLFDEWAAEQDPEFRRRFYHEIIPALKAAGKTVIAITHDEHYFHTADRVLRLDQGQLQPRATEPAQVHPAPLPAWRAG